MGIPGVIAGVAERDLVAALAQRRGRLGLAAIARSNQEKRRCSSISQNDLEVVSANEVQLARSASSLSVRSARSLRRSCPDVRTISSTTMPARSIQHQPMLG